MLMLNVKEGSAIEIAHFSTLVVDRIDVRTKTIHFKFESGDGFCYHRIVQGGLMQLITNVVVIVSQVAKGAEPLAAVGFDAPRHITIRKTR